MTIKSDLIAARALISDEERWTSQYHAIESTGAAVPAWHPLAYAFCADGALGRVCGVVAKPEEDVETDAGSWDENERYKAAVDLLNAASMELYGDTIVAVNDGEAEAVLRDIPETAPQADCLHAQYQAVLRCLDHAITTQGQG
jgi:hypothetical protein